MESSPPPLKRSERKALVRNIVEPYLTAKKDSTIRSQYKRIAAAEDGKSRTVLSPVVTETGRLSSSESFVDPSTNWQNLSKKESFKDELYRVRDVVIADPGMTLLAFDLDKAEAVVVGWESDNWDFYEDLISGADIHTKVAAAAYHGGNQKSVAKAERQRCKNVLYASFYMAGVPKITSTINSDATSAADRLTQAEVQVIYDVIMSWLELDRWWDRVWDELMDPDLYGGKRWLENCFGFRRMFYNPEDHSLHKEAVNFFPQSTVAGIIDNVLIEAWEEYDEPGVFELRLQVHDELIFQVRDDLIGHYVPIIKGLMERPFTARGREVYIPSGCEVGKRWDSFRGAKHEPLDPENTLERMVGYV